MIKTNFRGGIGGGFNYWDTYSDIIKKFESGIFIEIGLWDGESTVFMADLIKQSGKEIKFFAVDFFAPFEIDGVFHQANYYTYAANIEPYNDIINTIINNSHGASMLFDDKSVDFVFIDANHEYEFIKKDIEYWLPKIKPGGIIGGHDYADGVKKAVDEVFTGIITYDNSAWLKQL